MNAKRTDVSLGILLRINNFQRTINNFQRRIKYFQRASKKLNPSEYEIFALRVKMALRRGFNLCLKPFLHVAIFTRRRAEALRGAEGILLIDWEYEIFAQPLSKLWLATP